MLTSWSADTSTHLYLSCSSAYSVMILLQSIKALAIHGPETDSLIPSRAAMQTVQLQKGAQLELYFQQKGGKLSAITKEWNVYF